MKQMKRMLTTAYHQVGKGVEVTGYIVVTWEDKMHELN